jgi:cellulose synthase (UDP-forming)
MFRVNHRSVLILAALLFTACGAAAIAVHAVGVARAAIAAHELSRLVEIGVLYGLVAWLVAGTVIYLIADFGHQKRVRWVAPTVLPPARFHAGQAPAADTLLLLVPSYKEEESVIRQALVSAALVEHPRRRVVLLIDDPPNPTTPADARLLARSRRSPDALQAAFDTGAGPFTSALDAFRARQSQGTVTPRDEAHRLARLYVKAAEWLERQGPAVAGLRSHERSHTDRLFLDKILREPARALRQHASQLARRALSPNEIADQYERLAGLFRVEFAAFERKRYENLSHAPNKAMNLNSYIALVGRAFREVARAGSLHLEPCDGPEATIRVPAATYIATLDADSLVTADFARRLVAVMEAPGNERIAVAQTPYTAIPGAPVALERTAAASTDVQFFGHQGMAYLGASWWVGASALMRHAALEDIAVDVNERGHPVRVYIQDRILIEDAAATVDLLNRGWRIYHDPGRLSYSATPSDFGALIIQRRRWSNGGLLILPALLRYVFRWPWSLVKFQEGILRGQNLLTATFSGIGLPLLLFFRFDDSLVPPWMPLVGVPYFIVYGYDLALAGYRWTDLPRLYALNTSVLIPVYLAGTLQSLRQALTGRLIPFKRTPKTQDRTPAPAVYHLVVYAILVFCLACFIEDLFLGRYTHAVFSLFNGAVTFYGCAVLIGFGSTWADVRLALASRRLPSSGRRSARGRWLAVPQRGRPVDHVDAA